MMKFFTTKKKELIRITVLVIIAICSMFIVSKIATNPQSYKATIQSIDDKKNTVMSVAAGAASTSTLLAFIPGDGATPIANQIMQISSYLMIVVCALVLEKSLLTVMGYLSFKILIPVSCGLLAIHTFCKKEFLRNIALKFIAFAIVIVSIVPISMKIGDMIYEVNSTVIEQITVEDVDTSKIISDDKNSSLLDSAVEKIKNGFSDTVNYAKQKLSQFIDVIAIFIIAYCAVPIIVVITLIWLVKLLFGIKIPLKSDKNDNLLAKNEQ